MTPIDVRPADLDTVRRILREHVPALEVHAFGSRVAWNARETSDLDLALMTAKPLSIDRTARLRAAFTDSDLPFRVDIVDWATISQSFRQRILENHVALRADRDEWPIRRFEELLDEPVRNGIYKSKEHHGHGVKIVNMGEIFAHSRLRAVPMRRVGLSESEIERFAIAKGDLLFARRSLVAEGAGKCCVVLDVDEPTAFESSIIRARPAVTTSDPSYLYYFFCSPSGLHCLDTIRRQVAVAGITGRDLSGLEIPAPPLPEQRAIAHILGTLDDKIELNRQMNATLEAMARALFRSWFVDFDPVRAKMEGRDTGLPKDIADLFPDRLVDSELGEIPEGWPLVPLSELIEVNPPRSLRRGEIAPYLDMANMPTLGHAPDSIVQRPFNSGMRFANGDALVARITPCLENGKTAYVDFLRDGETGWGSTEYIVMKSRPLLPSEFAYLLARSARFREFAIQNMSGTSGRQRVPAAALSGFTIPSPPALVGTAFGLAVQSFLRRARAAVDECRVLANCRDALLPKLVSGEVRVTGPEPASGRDDHPVPVATHGA